MTLTEWFYQVFNNAMARWVAKDPVNAEAKVAGLLDRLFEIELVWDTIGSWLDANPDRVAPFIVNFLEDASQPAEETPAP